MITKLCLFLGLGILGCVLSSCTMTLSVDTLEAGSKTSSSWQKSSASESRTASGVDILSSQGSSMVLDQVPASEALKPVLRGSRYNRYLGY